MKALERINENVVPFHNTDNNRYATCSPTSNESTEMKYNRIMRSFRPILPKISLEYVETTPDEVLKHLQSSQLLEIEMAVEEALRKAGL